MKTPLNNAVLQGNVNAAGRKITALDMSDYAGLGLSWNTITGKFDSVGASVAGQNIFYPEAYGAVGDGTTDDTTAMQQCIDAAVSAGGIVRLSPVTYKITTALSITDSVAIEGMGMFPQNGTANVAGNQSMNLPYVSPYLKGSVILQAGAGQNGITISSTGVGVNLRNFGIRFDDAIKFTNTGHGIFCEAAAYLGHRDSGIMSSMWSNLGVYGHDGSHYAYHFTNPICSTFDHLTGWGGGGIRVENNANWSYYGNCVFEHPYFCTCVAGSAHGYHVKIAASSNPVYFLTFIRPQVNVQDAGVATPPTNAQNTFRLDGTPAFLNLFAPDLETNVGSTTFGVYGSTTVNVTPGHVDNDPFHWGEFGGDMKINGKLTLISGTITTAVPVASLPASPTLGQIATVNDGTAALAWGATVTGGEATKYIVCYNGTNWTVMGK
jgi:hypothetical protein